MEFELSEDQRAIRSTARELLEARLPWEAVREHAEAGTQHDELQRELTGLGWAGIAVPEDLGGQGLGLVELTVLLEQLGYVCAPVPLPGSAHAALLIDRAGSTSQREQWLPDLADGSRRGAVGHAAAGRAGLVPDGDGADVVVLVEEGELRLVTPADARVAAVAAVDPTRRFAEVEVDPGAGEPLEGDVSGALERLAVARAAGIVGLCQRALDMTVAYVKERQQFGVPIGSFQAVSHRAAQMLLDTEAARSAMLFAAWAADADPDEAELGATMAAAAAVTAARAVPTAAIQLHGGIGFTWEADVHWIFKRAQVDAAMLGSLGDLRARIARQCAARRTVLAAEATG